MLRPIMLAAISAVALRAAPWQSVQVHVHVQPVRVHVAPVRWLRVADVRAVIDAAHNVPAAVCALAASAVNNGNWGRNGDAPVTPLLSRSVDATPDNAREGLTPPELQLLLASIASSDVCVRELAVRFLAYDESGAAVTGLTQRLGTADSLVRETAVFGLGMLEPASAVDPLTRALRDPVAGVRANAAWALGRIEAGRTLGALTTAMSDADALVRLSATAAVGRFDSTSASAARIRRVRQDTSPRYGALRRGRWAIWRRPPAPMRSPKRSRATRTLPCAK